jgi:hypothetical protein
MGSDGKAYYATLGQLLEEIAYAYEDQYPPRIYKDSKGLEYVSFYKLGLCETGIGSYKMDQFEFAPHLWPKIKKLAELLTITDAEKVLYDE